MRALRPLVLAAVLPLAGCATTPSSGSGAAPTPQAPRAVAPASGETHLEDVRQLTFGGENAEAYWAFRGDQLIYQARRPGEGCDRIWRLTGLDSGSPAAVPVSSGAGATTCAYFLPGDMEVIYGSTHLGSPECPPRPDMREGYVWALYDSYDVFRASADGTNVRRLTDTPGYDAEATVCAKDGSIVFTSVRDGDIELYRMDADGKNVKRLTHTPGYDGGAFFNHDCSKLVWRASRPTGAALEDYRALLKRGLVRPSKLELYVANADGSEPVQVTYLDAASFAPFWFPDRNRILFSSNAGDPKGREFNLWAVDADGTDLEQVTFAPGFDGFPMFSPDGKQLVFGSNRGNAPGARDTNLFLARWVEAPAQASTRNDAPERLAQDATWLAAPERTGRGVGTPGLELAGAFIEARFRELGLTPAGDRDGYRQSFAVTTGMTVEPGTRLRLAGKALDGLLAPLAFSASAKVKAPLVFAGYGIVAPEANRDDYKGLNVKGKVVLVRRFTPEGGAFADAALQRKHGDLRAKAWTARERGAAAVLVVDWPESVAKALPSEAAPPTLRPEGVGDLGIPVAVVRREAVESHLRALARGGRVPAEVSVALAAAKSPAFNVVARLAAGAPEGERFPGTVVVGAHYDHLGLGGPGSLAPGVQAAHLGADDNASGVAALLEVARALASMRSELRRDVVFVAFSGEEAGVLGSTHFTRAAGGVKDVVAMLNMDMVGRMRGNTLQVLGAESAAEWRELVEPACTSARVACTLGGDGYGPSDHMPFFAAGVPVLHFFTGAHADYHKPSDRAEALNVAGMAQTAQVVADVTRTLAARPGALSYRQAAAPTPRVGDMRSGGASLGTVPDYAGPPAGVKGVLLAGVRPGGAADQAGMRRGDVLVRLGKHAVGSVEDFMLALGTFKPGDRVDAVVLRDGKEVALKATLQESRRQ